MRYPISSRIGDLFARVVIEPVCMWDDPQSGGLGSVNASNFGRDHDVSHFGGDHLFMGVY